MLVAEVPIDVASPVLVSSDSVTEACVAMFVQPVVSYLSYVSVDVLYLIIPVTLLLGLAAVVPLGSVIAPGSSFRLLCVM